MPCNKPCEVYTRVVGYFQEKRRFNPAKQKEAAERVNYKINKKELTPKPEKV